MTVKNKHYVQLGHFEGQMCKRSKQGPIYGSNYLGRGQTRSCLVQT